MKKEIGKSLLINFKWAIVQAGHRKPIFTTDDRIDYIENRWFIQLHDSLQLMTGKLLIQGIDSGTINRIHDQYLMDVWDQSNLSISSLYQLNLCRMYLRFTKLSYIVSNDEKLYSNSTYISHEATLMWNRNGQDRIKRLLQHGNFGKNPFF